METVLYQKIIETAVGEKRIEVMHADMTQLSFPVDVMVCSAFADSYAPTRGTLIGALYRERGISVHALSRRPVIDMRNVGAWLSAPTGQPMIERIACVELRRWREPSDNELFAGTVRIYIERLRESFHDPARFHTVAVSCVDAVERYFSAQRMGESYAQYMAHIHDLVASGEPTQTLMDMLQTLAENVGASGSTAQNLQLDWRNERASDSFSFVYAGLFMMLRLAAMQGLPVHTVVMPLLGTGCQRLNADSSLKGLIAECRNALRDIPAIRRIVLAELSAEKAERIAAQVRADYADTTDKSVFISYSHADRLYAELLAELLKQVGVKTWIDSEQIMSDDFGGVIVEAISRAELFAILLSKNSMRSKHVLAELQNAFDVIGETPKILPIRLDETPYPTNFSYYLKGKHYEMASEPPIEEKIRLIAKKVEHDVKNS